MKQIKKKVLISAIAVLLLIFLYVPNIFGCTVSIVPSKTEVEVEETISIDILRTKTHKTCVLPLDETKIEVVGGEIVKEYPWITGTPDKKTIEVKFTTVSDAVIKVTRDCPKGGLMVWTATIKVVNGSDTNSTTTVSSTQDSSSSGTSSNTTATSNTGASNNTNVNNASSSTVTPNTSSSTPSSNSSSVSSSNSSESTSSSQTQTDNSKTTSSEEHIENPSNSQTNTNEVNTQEKTSNTSTSNITLQDIFTTQNILYLLLLFLALLLYILKKFKLRYLLLLFSVAVLGFYFGGCPCIMGYIEKIFISAVGSKVFILGIVMIGIITPITLFKGRIFCGWVCPHGALQEFLFQKKIALKISPSLDRKLKYIKYLVLILVIAFAIVNGVGILCKFEPFKSIYSISLTGIALIIVILTLISSVFIYRPWCRYICPFGAYLGVVAFIGSKLHLVNGKISNSCILCKNCVRNCPANATIEKVDHYEIDCKECFMCGDCHTCCPKNKP
ncbi:4Fe-4S binding protein [Caldisericum exile]|uniref:Iron-sulfur binding protein n=1 Tax=Caldisericum exile (strain DSM 21853 / NBRC 104410 / AZM16c01) TaxID=511051 RepID=A0A7U6GFP3_CALEA|nr:4Fe-4S binding protein [Caldisericum exile]BAL81556.1 iron-sulfur binding protein [Caldisericum exile AZM16c01]